MKIFFSLLVILSQTAFADEYLGFLDTTKSPAQFEAYTQTEKRIPEITVAQVPAKVQSPFDQQRVFVGAEGHYDENIKVFKISKLRRATYDPLGGGGR